MSNPTSARTRPGFDHQFTRKHWIAAPFKFIDTIAYIIIAHTHIYIYILCIHNHTHTHILQNHIILHVISIFNFPHFTSTLAPATRKHRKITIRHFAAESLALVFRRIPSSGMSQAGVDVLVQPYRLVYTMGFRAYGM